MGYAGANWVEASLKVRPGILGTKVADILGAVWRGIYHIDEKSLRRVNWLSDRFISLTVRNDLATYDYSELTELVVLAHDAGVRLSIRSGGPSRLVLTFSLRDPSSNDMVLGHPTIEVAIERARKLAAEVTQLPKAVNE